MVELDAWVQRHPWPRIAGVGAALGALPLVGTWWAVGWADVALGGGAVVVWGLTALATHTRRRLDELPLELAPCAAIGVVDGREQVRFRARLGLGRAFTPQATVRFLPDDGEAQALAAFVPTGPVCGPVLILVDAASGPGRYEVLVEAHERGRQWAARATYAAEQVREGRFCDGIEAGARTRFTDGWGVVR